MAVDVDVEKECNALAACFQFVVTDMKALHPLWEDVSRTATKLGSQIKVTVGAVSAFLDALQRVADHAANAKGGTRDIGTALTRICLRHRQTENRLRALASALTDCLGQPMAQRADDWRTRAASLDKERAKEHKRRRQQMKRAAGGTLRAKRKSGREAAAAQAAQEWAETCTNMVEAERSALRAALLEQRAQFCQFASNLDAIMNAELGLMDEHGALKEVQELMRKHTAQPDVLPESSEAVIHDIKGLEHTLQSSLRSGSQPTGRFAAPFSSAGGSPTATTSSMGSRKSSFCSLSSADSHLVQQQLQQQHAAAQQAAARATLASNAATLSPHHVGSVPAGRCHSQLQCSPTGPTGRFSSQDSGCFATSSHDPIYTPINTLPTFTVPSKSSDDDSGSGKRHVTNNDSSPLSSASPPSPSDMPSLSGDSNLPQDAEQWPAPPPCVTAEIAASAAPQRQDVLVTNRHSSNVYANATVRQQPQQQRASVTDSVLNRFARPASLGIVSKPPKPTPTKSKQQLRAADGTPAQTPTPTVCYSSDPTHMVPDFYAAVHEQVHVSYANGYAVPLVGGAGGPHNQHQQQQQQVNAETSRVSAKGGRARPLSFVCDDSDDLARLLQASSVHGRRPPSASAVDSPSAAMLVSCASDSSTRTVTADSVATTSHSAASERHRESRRLNSTSTFIDESDCSVTYAAILTPAEMLTPSGQTGANRRASTVSSASSSLRAPAPALPQRRNSTITGATDNAPSVQQVRQRSRCTTPIGDDVSLASVSDVFGMRYTYEQQYAVAVQRAAQASPAPAVSHEQMMMQIRAGVRLRSPPNAETQSNRQF